MTTYDVTGTADCPSMTFTLAGTADSTAYDALAADIRTWSDGYNITLLWTFTTLYYAEMANDTTLEVAFGNAATLTTAANGAYNHNCGWAWDSTNSEVDMSTALTATYIPTAVATTAGDLGKDSTSVVAMTDAKYDFTASPVVTGTADYTAVDGTYSGMFYMPSEPATAATGETDATGDRLDTGDVLGVFCGTAEPTATGSTTLTLTLGAASLAAAGSAALATALAF